MLRNLFCTKAESKGKSLAVNDMKSREVFGISMKSMKFWVWPKKKKLNYRGLYASSAESLGRITAICMCTFCVVPLVSTHRRFYIQIGWIHACI